MSRWQRGGRGRFKRGGLLPTVGGHASMVESQKVRYSQGASDDNLIANPSPGVGLARLGDALSFDP
jgi:hypothetical protein